jgi:arginase family enzyme
MLAALHARVASALSADRFPLVYGAGCSVLLAAIPALRAASAALRTGGCRGWSVAVYNPDLDPGRQAATRIVTFVTDVVRNWL